MAKESSIKISAAPLSALTKPGNILSGVLADLMDEVESSERTNCLYQEGLFNGIIGLAYYYYHLFKITAHKRYLRKSISYIRQVICFVGKEDQMITYYSNFAFGMSGLAFVLAGFGPKSTLSLPVAEITRDLEDLIYQSMIQQVSHNQYSLLFGFSGSLFYFNTKDDKTAAAKISGFLEHLESETGFRHHASVTEYLKKTLRSALPNLNFSLINGVSGVFYVILLVAIKHPEIDKKFKLRDIISDFLNFILVGFVNDNPHASVFNIVMAAGSSGQTRKNNGEGFAAYINDLYMVLFFVRYCSFYGEQSMKTTVGIFLDRLVNNNERLQHQLLEQGAFVESATITELFNTLHQYAAFPELGLICRSMATLTEKCLYSKNNETMTWDQKAGLIKGYPIVILSQLSFLHRKASSSWNKVLFL
jgi:hypothetical protein